jgi:glycosyltransferase involved in cell wall biosynthesis
MSRKIRVMQLIDTLGDGGAESLLVTFAAGMDRARFDMHVCAMRPFEQQPRVAELAAHGVPFHIFHQRGVYDLPALWRIVRYIRRNRIDVIHTHLLASDILGRVAGFLTGRPVVSTIHNSRADLDKEPARRQWMERVTARWMGRRLIVVAENLREEIAAWFGVPLDKVVAITNGVDTDRFHRDAGFDRAAVRRALAGGDFPLATSVGRLVPQKAQHILIAAAALVAAQRPDTRIVLLGEGPLAADLAAQAAQAGVTDQVIFSGFRNDVADILAASSIFVLSSAWEGLPIALLEAMAAGCAAVCTDVGGVSQVLEHGVTGLLVPPNDPAALAAALLACFNDPARTAQMGEAGRRAVVERYSMAAWVRRCEALYLQEVAPAVRRQITSRSAG